MNTIGNGITGTLVAAALANCVAVVDDSLLERKSQRLPSLQANLNTLCGKETSLQDILIEDIDGNGRKDLVFNLWCMTSELGKVYDGPTPNNLVIWLQDNAGNFYDGTEKLLGKKFFDLGGHGMQVASHDFNRDGKVDFVWSVNHEDGRNTDYPAASSNAQNAYFISNPARGLDFEKRGQMAWNYSLTLADNEVGGKDLISLPIGYGGKTEAWRYGQNGWHEIGEYSWAQGQPLFFSRLSATRSSSLAVDGGADQYAVGLRAHTRDSSGTWLQSDFYRIPYTGDVRIQSWNLSTNVTKVARFQGKNYIYLSIGDNTCEYPQESGSMLISSIWGYELPDDYAGKTLNEWDLKVLSKLVAFNIVGGRLAPNEDFQVQQETTDASVTKIKCEDVNSDGRVDIVQQQWKSGSFPLVYLNNGALKFSPMAKRHFPEPNQFRRGLQQHYVDVDGDGIRDLLVIPTAGFGEGEAPTFYLYKGRRNAVMADTQ